MRVAIKTLGCRQNQYESDALLESMRRDGQIWVGPGEEADLCIINTCTVTKEADADSRQMIRRAIRDNPSARVVVTGCYAQVAAGEIASIPGVDLVAGNGEKARLLELIHGLSRKGPPLIAVGDIRRTRTFEPLPPPVAGSRSRAFLKVQDGCNYRCTFCIIPETRGPNRSQPKEAALRDLRALMDAGYPEVVLTGIHLGTYGRDLPTRGSIAGLLGEMLEVAAPARIRLSSLDPHEVGDDLIGLFGRFGNLCRHLHLPLQSGDDRVLTLMRRAYKAEMFRRLVERLAEAVPGIAIGADVIVGFPGEGEVEFERTYRLLERLPIAYLHVFSYSQRDGTVAASMRDQVPKSVKASRSFALRSLSEAKWSLFRRTQVGQPLTAVVLDRRDARTGRLEALTDNYVTVAFDGGQTAVGRTVNLTIEAVSEGRTLGRMRGV
ncbi:MAG: tRNA (N(6)-L-threonylcarbamoyladenosine(37)-C(2))-methylthiotransferase MtaB [Candidatus Methylomirabilis oxyfera]|nr:tRNA (N(6)-L-threonylcarbamoyladenosine(37)-C(2))-methylthiotransferase MtaB [Candidatus Methylomirabilis oxyfera]